MGDISASESYELNELWTIRPARVVVIMIEKYLHGDLVLARGGARHGKGEEDSGTEHVF